MTTSEKKKHCVGCRDNFYNGNNPYGINECWHLAEMKLIWRKPVRMDEKPPWNGKSQRLPSCYSNKDFIFVQPDRKGWENKK